VPSAPGQFPRIRRAVPSDCRAIAEVHVAAWRETYAGLVPDDVLRNLSIERREDFWRGAVTQAQSTTRVFVAEIGVLGIVGFAACGPRRSALLTQDGEIFAIYLRRPAQRRGLGRRLMRAMAADMLARGLNSAAAWVLEGNHGARRFYERLGGVLVGEQTVTLGEVALREVAYGWADLAALAGRSG